LRAKQEGNLMTVDPVAAPVEEQTEEQSCDVFEEQAPAGGHEPWMEYGLCGQTDPESFFPEKGGSTREAKAICKSCDVRAECLDYAIDHDERFGIWGARSERERRKVKKDGYKVMGAQYRRSFTLQPVEITAAPPRKFVQPTTQSVPRKAQETMNDAKRFPAILAFIKDCPGQVLLVNGSPKATVPHEVLKKAKLDSVTDLRRVLRKLGRECSEVSVMEDAATHDILVTVGAPASSTKTEAIKWPETPSVIANVDLTEEPPAEQEPELDALPSNSEVPDILPETPVETMALDDETVEQEVVSEELADPVPVDC
jgi:WhiB family redox-sensing transcriptional regulator